jgi:hypothetical protein
MSLLLQIQESAIDGNSDLETLLRKCRLLAARLKHDDLKNWVQWELDGYRRVEDVPDYRKFRCHCFGHFTGAFGRGLRNAPIPIANIPSKFREMLTTFSACEGVASLRNTIEECKDGVLQIPWPADANAIFGDKIYEHLVLGQAWKSVPKSLVVGILSTVRNRILNFAIQIEASNPDAGEAGLNISLIPQEVVSHIFNTNIYGNVGNVASGHGITQSANVFVNQGDFPSLAAFLQKQGVAKGDVEDLEKALLVETKPKAIGFGKKVSAWMGKMIQKSAEGTWKVATDVASSVLTEAIKKYYGI